MNGRVCRRSLSFILPLTLSACWDDAEERFNVGYDDGYAVGYNLTCKIRTTLIEGDWENPDYSRGYRRQSQ